MNLHLPQFTATSAEIERSPNSIRAVRRWKTELPLVNMGETTRLFYLQLRALNRQALTGKSRFELMEELRPTAHIVLAHLEKHLRGLTHPLRGKVVQIAKLNEALLLEMAVGYKHIIHDIVNKNEKVDSKILVISVHRAMRYLELNLVLLATLYKQGSAPSWHDLHRLQGFAEQQNFADNDVTDEYYTSINASSITDVYKQTCLLAMSQPLRLRTGEADKLRVFYETACHLCEVKKALIPDENGLVHVVSLKSSEPPDHIPLANITTFSNLRGFDLNRLISTLSDMSADEADHSPPPQAGLTKVRLDKQLIQRLIGIWSTQEKRRYTRVATNRSIIAATGLKNIISAIHADVRPELAPEEQFKMAAEYDENGPTGDAPSTSSIMQPSSPDNSGGFGATYHSDLLLDEESLTQTNDAPPASWQEWQIINTGAGGYGLVWNKDQASNAQVGEVIALREKEYAVHHWRTGVVRWLHNSQDRGLEIGLQLLAPRAIVVSIESIMNRGYREILPMDALMLPGLKTIQQPTSLLATTGIFQPGDVLEIALLNRKVHIELKTTGESPSFFTQFYYVSTEIKEESTPKEEFEDLWRRL